MKKCVTTFVFGVQGDNPNECTMLHLSLGNILETKEGKFKLVQHQTTTCETTDTINTHYCYLFERL